MATITADQVGVELFAEVDSYLRDLKRAESGFGIIMAKMEREAETAGRDISKALSGGGIQQFSGDPGLMYRAMSLEAAAAGRAVERIGEAASAATPTVSRLFSEGSRLSREMQAQAILAGRQIQQIGAQSTVAAGQVGQLGNAAQTSSFNVANIGAQFQDIGVTAAMGMNPMIIALQQGTQLSAVLNASMAAGQSPVRALGAAFTQILNPISLGTIAIVALTAAAAQYFGSLINDGKVSNDELKEQESLIREVAEKWGEAVPALRAYVDELDRAKDTGSLSEATDIAIKQQYEELVRVVGDLRAEFAAARVDIQQLGGDAQEIDVLQAAFDDLQRKAEDSTATAEDLNAVIALIGNTTGSTAPGVQALSGVLGGLANAFAAAAQQAAIFRQERDAALAPDAQVTAFNDNKAFIAEQERINGLTSEELALEREIDRVKSQADRQNVPLGDAQALDIAEKRLAAEERRRQVTADTKSGAKSESEAEREAKAVLDLIAALEYEQSILGMTAEQQAVSNALRDAGAAATDAQRARIEELVLATMEEEEAIKRTEDAMRKFQDMATNAVTSFIGDLREGKSAAEALGNVFDNLATQLINIAAQNLISAAFGGIFGGGGGGIGGILSGIFGGARAGGGPVSSGKSYLVGERGPELFSPSTAGNITPNNALTGGGQSEVIVYVQSSEYFDGRVERVSGPVSARTTSSGLRSYDNSLASRSAEKDARYK